MAANLEQLEMLPPKGEPARLSDETQEEIARQCRDKHDAMIKCFVYSNLEPKQVYGPLKMSQTQFSLFMNRKAYIPHDLEHDFMRRCGNLIPHRFDAWQLGFELRRIKSGLEARVSELEADNAAKDLVISYLLKR